MYSISAYDDKELEMIAMQSIYREELISAIKLFEQDKYDEGHAVLESLIDSESPEALLISATYSTSIENEYTYSERHIAQVRKAADFGLPLALYTLGVYYDIGDLIPKDTRLARECFQKAAEMGHPKSMYTYGIDLYYGENSEDNKKLGLEMLTQAAKLGDADAKAFKDKLLRGS